jgi:uncharacterized protein
MSLPFWKSKSLAELTLEEWESLCDGCGKCCIIKFEDEDTGVLYHTNVACEFLDIYRCHCTHYPDRSIRVPACVALNPNNIQDLYWMPKTCAYRLLAEGKNLPAWHPLISGNHKSVHKAGASVRGKVVSARDVPEEDLEDYVVEE